MIRKPWAGLAAAALLSAPALAVAAPAPPQPTPFEREILASKTSMMGEPQVAFDHARKAAAEAAALPESEERQLAMATAQWLEGESSTRMRKPGEAESYLRRAADTVARLKPNSKLQGDILRSRGRGAAAVGRVQEALADYQEAFRIYQRAAQPRSQAMVLQDIGSVYMDARDYAHVLQYYRQSGEVFTSDPVLSLTAHNNRGAALKALGRLPEALVQFQGALTAAAQVNSAYLQAEILSDIAFTEVLLNRPDQARLDVQRGLALAAADSEARGERPFLLAVRARIEADRGDPVRAAHTLDEAFSGVDLTKTTMDYRDFHEVAARIYAKAGQEGLALKHMIAFKRLDDKGRELAASTNTALMAARFDFANQDLKIAKLKAGQLEAEARLRNLILTGLVLAGGSILAVTLLGLLSMRRSRDRIRAANAQLGMANTALERALKAKTEFLATTSHEIRTPLNGILGMTQVILADRGLSEGVRERLSLVQSSGETMKSLVDDLLDLAKVETGAITVDPQPFDLRRALAETEVFWSGQAQSKNLRLDFDVGEAPRRIVADQSRLRQVIFNLMSNALKFTETGSVTLRACVEGETLVITVKDTGIGIPAHEQERIFEAFTQVDGSTSRKYGGTGLGLSICRSVSAAMGGSIGVESAEGAGAAFGLRLPLVLAEATVAACTDARKLEDAVVLVVDANPLSQSMLKAVLAPASRAVSCVNSLAGAVESLAAAAADLVVIDATVLAEEPAAVLARVRESSSSARIVVTWPKTAAAAAPPVSPTGADAVVFKPAPLPDILTAVEAVLSSHRRTALADAA